MAIGTTPLFSKISGSVGPVDYRTRRNGKIEIGKKRIPANPQSTRQLEVRNGYGRLHELWQNASYIDKAQYERVGELLNISPWNAFLLRHQPAMNAAPVASWGMVESSGLEVHDQTINANTGHISGCTWAPVGPYGLSTLHFNGIDDWINCGNDPSVYFIASSKYTFEFWIYFTGLPTDDGKVQYIFSKRTGGMGYIIDVDITDKMRIKNPNGWDQIRSTSKLTKNKWYQTIITYDSGTITLYLNCILEGAGTAGTWIDDTTSPFKFGYVSTNYTHDGLLAAPRFYNSILPFQTFVRHYTVERPLYGEIL